MEFAKEIYDMIMKDFNLIVTDYPEHLDENFEVLMKSGMDGKDVDFLQFLLNGNSCAYIGRVYNISEDSVKAWYRRIRNRISYDSNFMSILLTGKPERVPMQCIIPKGGFLYSLKKEYGIFTVEQLSELSYSKLRNIHGIGVIKAAQILTNLAKYGYKTNEEVQEEMNTYTARQGNKTKSPRGNVLRTLARSGYKSVKDLAGMTEAEVLEIEGIGPKALIQIKSLLNEEGITLKGSNNCSLMKSGNGYELDIPLELLEGKSNINVTINIRNFDSVVHKKKIRISLN